MNEMTQTELAESMAVLLGWKYVPADSLVGQDLWVSPDGEDDVGCWEPDGFCLIWDKVAPKTIIFHDTQGAFKDPDKKSRCVLFDSSDKNPVEGYGSDRYRALCSAVHEMRMK